ncbi:type I restriction endonuclease [Crocosphaera chwakensis]|uniref:Restriction endonuclease type I HsdR N-terminal domain-containing protein n=1 Tax=Crocosphaera chwakensis CCY0110 TaxID=391612 RepID=A3IN39_9CHRO|nr:type I restriction endonuclease [Crocosphaera chwakensis]EAZ92016.1 hypothetical protein CY0110_00120 [Crocosphaera chwakensis CCY0110]
MDLIDRLKTISQQIEKLSSSIQTEEATKTAFIMPFIQALGYDVFNPMEVHPEYTADLPELKGEKVDYAIFADDEPIILMECKHCQENLDNPKHRSQLHRYFHVTDTKIAILTNGILYRFYTDTDKDNVMDDKPFFEFDISNFDESSVKELKRFSKSNFNHDELGDVAKNLLYTKEIKRVIADELTNPSPGLVKYVIDGVYPGIKTAAVIEKFTEITKCSLKEYINERIKERLESAMGNDEDNGKISPVDPVIDDSENSDEEESNKKDNRIVTTPEELEGFYLVKSILREVIDTSRLSYKDTIAYFGINLDGKVTKTICRLRFTNNKKVIGVLDGKGKEAKHCVSNLDEIYGFSEFLKARIKHLTQDSYVSQPEQSEII